jgi:hypothetical protein
MAQKHPALKAAFDATFEQVRPQGQFAATERSPLTINVVVHVVWKNPAENLPDSIVLNQIQVLNEDFNRQNPDTANLRPEFQAVAGSADIHFNLVTIERVQTTQDFEIDLLGGTFMPELKNSAQGGSDAWDPTQYLNIWVCNIQPTTIFGVPVGQILGFAFPPNGLDNWPGDVGAPSQGEDGVVVDYRMVGRNNPNTVEVPGGNPGELLEVRGRTPVHEVGHYLGLRHIWGDGGLFGPNDCDQSDGVDDTPFANAQSPFDCDLERNSCAQVEIFYNEDPLDLVENYMDYSREGCMNMFTKGQVTLMRNVLQGPRSGLLTPVSTGAPTADALQLRVSPNPVGNGGPALVQFQLEAAGRVQLLLRDANGRLCRALERFDLPAGPQQISLDLNGLPAGLFVLELHSATGVHVQKVIKN